MLSSSIIVSCAAPTCLSTVLIISKDAQRIAPLITSLDGIDAPSMHYTSVLPSLMQSRLRPQLAILEAAHFLESQRWQPLDLAETRRMIALKGEIIARINDMISKDFNKTYQEAIQAVLHLALLEVRNMRMNFLANAHRCASIMGAISRL
jgi:hypothetical protein